MKTILKLLAYIIVNIMLVSCQPVFKYSVLNNLNDDVIVEFTTNKYNGYDEIGGTIEVKRSQKVTLFYYSGIDQSLISKNIKLNVSEIKKVYKKFNVYLINKNLENKPILSVENISESNLLYSECGGICFENIIVIH